MLLFFILFLSVYLGGNVYIFIKGLHAFSSLPTPVGILVGILFWVCALLIVGVFVFRDAHIPPVLGQWMQYIGTGWLVFTLYMTILLLITDLMKLFHFHLGHGFEIALAITFLVLCYGFYKYKHPAKEVINIVINKPLTTNQPIKVVAISDVHLGYATNKQQLRKYVDNIMKEKPDLIVIGGDLIDNSVVPVEYQRMEEELSILSAPLGVYMVPGNHEYISGEGKIEQFIKNTPIQLIKDSVVVLPNGIQLVGRDDRANPHRKSLQELMVSVDPTRPIVLLDHQPYHLEEAETQGVDLQFSGHTHRGQVFPMSLVTDRLFEVSYGYKKKGNTHIYVSSGLSLWGPPFRIGTQSEMVIFEINFQE